MAACRRSRMLRHSLRRLLAQCEHLDPRSRKVLREAQDQARRPVEAGNARLVESDLLLERVASGGRAKPMSVASELHDGLCGTLAGGTRT
jgi:hypothetical protein